VSRLAALALAALLAGCASRGGYYKDDGPGGPPPVNLDRLADATPRVETLNPGANTPYTALGRKYTPYTSLRPYRARGVASWYGRAFHGKRTASGERYDMYAMTAAHTILPIPSYARITNLANGRSVVVRINDRGPFHSDRIIDLSYAAAYKLGYVAAGSAKVEVEAILPGKSATLPEPRRDGPV
jgi:peptidoglycan lytic transglycosylase